MVDEKCKTCAWYDTEYVCTCPSNEPWQCMLDKEAVAELDKAFEEWKRSADNA